MDEPTALERIKAAVAAHEPPSDGVTQWYVDELCIDCDAAEFWREIAKALGDEHAAGRGFTRGQVQDAISAWRDGASFDALHPLRDRDHAATAILYDDNAMKDLARVITAVIHGRPLERPSGTVAGHVVTDTGQLPA